MYTIVNLFPGGDESVVVLVHCFKRSSFQVVKHYVHSLQEKILYIKPFSVATTPTYNVMDTMGKCPYKWHTDYWYTVDQEEKEHHRNTVAQPHTSAVQP